MSSNTSRFKKRLGRMYRSEKLGIIIPVEGEEPAGKGKAKKLRNNDNMLVPALLNTGFTSNELDIHVPKDTASKLGLWYHHAMARDKAF